METGARPEPDIFEIARNAWSQAINDFYNPPVPDPIIENDNKSTSFFYIDDKTWTVHINLAGVPHYMTPLEAGPFLRSICHHELQHYLVCPYDTVTSGMMFARAKRHVNNATAMFVCNLFADLVVDSILLKRFPILTHDRILSAIHESALRGEQHSDLWLLIVSCYRVMWGFPVPPSVKIPNDTFEAAEAIVSITRKYCDYEQRWPKATEKIARIISKWRTNESNQLPGMNVTHISDIEPDGNTTDEHAKVFIPADVDAIMGDPVEVRNGSVLRRCMESDTNRISDDELERIASEVEARGGNLDDLHAVYILMRAGNKGGNWIRFWYRAKVKRLIQIDIHEQSSEWNLPLTPQVWRLGDSIEELDIVQSLQAFPILVPNLSTRKWQRIEYSNGAESKTPPDLLVVIDSSGSMTWSMSRTTLSGEYHLALVAAFGAINFALSRGCRIASINFSSDTKTTTWTRNRRSVEYVLLSYEGGGTIMPIQKIINMCSNANKSVLVLIITDAEIDNWDELIQMAQYLSNRGHYLFLFHIGIGELSKQERSSLTQTGTIIVSVNDVNDLVNLVLQKIRAIYKTI